MKCSSIHSVKFVTYKKKTFFIIMQLLMKYLCTFIRSMNEFHLFLRTFQYDFIDLLN